MPKDDDIRAAIACGQADVLASNVTPHPTVARLIAVPAAEVETPAERAVVWSNAARDALVARIHALAAKDPSAATTFAGAIDRAARGLGQVARGAAGLVPDTWETVVPGTPFVLAFDLVTWTKAGEVIAILHLFEAERDIAREGSLWT